TRIEPGPGEARGSPGKRIDPQRGEPATKGDGRGQEGVGEQSYEPIVPTKGGNRRAPARGGHGTHGREGENREPHRLVPENARHRTRERMSNGTQSTSRTGKGGSGAEILLDRSSSHTASAV